MKRSAIEVRVIRAVDQILAGHRVEDAGIECKLAFPSEESKTANQIAGLCNAAGGEPILIVVGVNEAAGTVQTQSGLPDTADWWARVTKYFDDGVHPDMTDVHVQVSNGATVLALALSTDRAPFVTKNNTGRDPNLWVPWRDGTRTRAAKRHELLLILADHTVLPEVEPTRAEMTLYTQLHTPLGSPSVQEQKVLTIEGSLFFSVSQPLFMPTHKQQLSVHIEGHAGQIPMSLTFPTTSPHTSTSDAGLVVDRSTVLSFKGSAILEVGSEFEEVEKAKLIVVRLSGHVDRALRDLSVLLNLVELPVPTEGYPVDFATTPLKKWMLRAVSNS